MEKISERDRQLDRNLMNQCLRYQEIPVVHA